MENNDVKYEQAGRGLTIETHPDFEISSEVREAGISKAKDMLDELGIDANGTGGINVYLGVNEKFSKIEYVNGEQKTSLLWMDNLDSAKTYAPEGVDSWDELKDTVEKLDKNSDHQIIEGADVRNPGENLEAVFQQNLAEDVQEIMQGNMDPDKVNDNFVKSEAEKLKDPDRKELKAEVQKLKKELDTLTDKAAHEISVMKAQGGDPIVAEKVSDTVKRISDKTMDLAKAQKELRCKTIEAVGNALTKPAKSAAHKIKTLGDKMICSGKEAIARITDRVHLANERSIARVKGAYTSVAHDVTQIHRDWTHINYTLEKAQIRVIDALQKHLVKAYAKKNERAAAVKNIGGDLKQLFTGRRHEPIQADQGLNKKQMKIITDLSRMKDEINKDAETYFASYNRSAVKDLMRMSKATEERNNLGLGEHRTLKGDIEKIKRQMSHDAKARSKDKARDIATVKNKSDDLAR